MPHELARAGMDLAVVVRHEEGDVALQHEEAFVFEAVHMERHLFVRPELVKGHGASPVRL